MANIKFDFQVKVVIETQTVSRLSPRVSNFFKFHHCSNEDVTCQMILSSQVKRLTSETCKVLGHMSEEVMEAAQKYVAHMIKCRQQMGVADDNVDIHQQVRPPNAIFLPFYEISFMFMEDNQWALQEPLNLASLGCFQNFREKKTAAVA